MSLIDNYHKSNLHFKRAVNIDKTIDRMRLLGIGVSQLCPELYYCYSPINNELLLLSDQTIIFPENSTYL